MADKPKSRKPSRYVGGKYFEPLDAANATKKEYRDYMAHRDYMTDQGGRYLLKSTSGKTPKRYYKHFDAGAARFEKRKTKRKEARR